MKIDRAYKWNYAAPVGICNQVTSTHMIWIFLPSSEACIHVVRRAYQSEIAFNLTDLSHVITLGHVNVQVGQEVPRIALIKGT